MSASRGWWAVPLLAVILVGWWQLREARWAGALYCIERPGTLWNGAASLPAGYTPECPASQSYRQEVRSGFSRVERYRTAGWQPKALLETLKQAGYRQITDDPIAPGNDAVFLQGPGGMVQYLATLQQEQTVVTLSGRPERRHELEMRSH
ncbi:hypothetical protein MF271_21760 (plasmid) [Deinococcus sp. KNUC1210]|uniref:hypothetical protein n=1 Tax=Deinococcus sp. KNUC1210 TaxID=2917691 RepID=UPI001EF07646|nr:hypothetical protein [Deinococcus sp. KNUC1210]ULH17828.1 hypothetical protein MF271_21760 [Deinococcus sp. KNUC1210]